MEATLDAGLGEGAFGREFPQFGRTLENLSRHRSIVFKDHGNQGPAEHPWDSAAGSSEQLYELVAAIDRVVDDAETTRNESWAASRYSAKSNEWLSGMGSRSGVIESWSLAYRGRSLEPRGRGFNEPGWALAIDWWREFWDFIRRIIKWRFSVLDALIELFWELVSMLRKWWWLIVIAWRTQIRPRLVSAFARGATRVARGSARYGTSLWWLEFF